jgi:predicted phosphate transport protein (TIGR00153 family)
MTWTRALVAIFRSNDRRFVELLCQQADLTLEILRLLPRFGEKGARAQELAGSMKDVEHRADEVRRILIDELTRTYATPFDREDLFALSRSIDDIVDSTDETAFELELYGVVPRNLGPMARLLLEGARHIRLGVGELLDHPGVAMQHAIRAKATENEVDALYHESVAQLLSRDGKGEMSDRLRQREVYRHLKNSADRIDGAADDISVIVIKRS